MNPHKLEEILRVRLRHCGDLGRSGAVCSVVEDIATSLNRHKVNNGETLLIFTTLLDLMSIDMLQSAMKFDAEQQEAKQMAQKTAG